MAEKDIKVNWKDLERVHMNIESARSSITELSYNPSQGQSNWIPFSLFKERAQELVELIKKYEHLLWIDSDKLREAASAIEEQDHMSSKKWEYEKVVGNSLRPDNN